MDTYAIFRSKRSNMQGYPVSFVHLKRYIRKPDFMTLAYLLAFEATH